MGPLTERGQEQNKEQIFHGHFWGGVKGLVTGGRPVARLVFTTEVVVDVAGLVAGVVAVPGAAVRAAGVDDLEAGALREAGFF